MKKPTKPLIIVLWFPTIYSAVVQSSDGENAYVVNFGRVTCTCPDFFHRRHQCKHIFHVMAQILPPPSASGTVTVPSYPTP